MTAQQDPYVFEHRIPTADEYIALRAHCGFPRTYDPALLQSALPASVFSVMVLHRETGQNVGMGRIIGDGLFYQITDIVVDKAHQGNGLGRGIMGQITRFLEDNARQGCYVSLLADGQAYRLYEQFGFKLTGRESLGMFRRF